MGNVSKRVTFLSWFLTSKEMGGNANDLFGADSGGCARGLSFKRSVEVLGEGVTIVRIKHYI